MEKISLSGAWNVKQNGESSRLPAQVPGCIHTDLINAGKIADPYYRDNERALQWIGECGWVYTHDVTISARFLKHAKIVLRCEGLDTLATIRINGTEVARTDNMFRTWEFDVKAWLHRGRNRIEVRFESPIPYIKQKQSERYLHGWNAPHEITGRSWIRKEPCNFGWDWGPVLITCGIWRELSLIGFDNARLTGVQIVQDHGTDGQVTLNVTPDVEILDASEYWIHVTARIDNHIVVESRNRNGEIFTLRIQDAQLWWPNGLGQQPLYEIQVEVLDAQGTILDSTSKRVGLRTLLLDRHPDQWGESFQFKVNGVPFFAKGGNWIPADTFATRMTPQRYRDLLQSVANANMNMLRVWGGGIYEADTFYDICDELGICIWHDFMFACSTYPAFDEHFMQSVRSEAEDNVRRLRHHPSIALWCGNNELEQGLVGAEWTDRQMSWSDYGKLFDVMLPEIVHSLDPQRSYWPASPHTPIGDRADFNNPTCGDAHLWDVWHSRKPFEWYRTCDHRFNSEFGFQSFPEPGTVYGYTEPKDRNVTSYVMEHHQRSGIGNAVIMHYMLDWFRLPTSFEHTLYLSQILQGMAMKYAVEHWRRAMPRGMGTLYWQINDCWPVASWSSIDYHGRWKALQYMAKRFYAPILVSGIEDLQSGRVDIHITNDHMEVSNGEVSWRLTTVEGKTIARSRKAVQVDALTNAMVEGVDCSPYLQKHGPRQLLMWLEYKVKGRSVSTNLVTFARPKHLELANPGIEMQLARLDDNTFAVTLMAAKPALWAWLELDNQQARYDDNFTHLLPGKPQRFVVTPARKMTLDQLRKKIKVNSLIDTYS